MDEMTQEEWAEWCGYQRWAIGPLMTKEQWLADKRLPFKEWCKRHGIG